MRSRALTGARAGLLAGPVALAFFSGGYFDTARAAAGLVAWALVAAAALLGAPVIPRGGPGRLTLAGLAALAAWTTLSLTWAPLAGTAYHDGQRVIMYAGALVAACALLRDRGALRAVEPAVAAGALVVIGYGISERLVPWALSFQRSLSAAGRLDQPLTYWNAMGELAALGLVVCARLAGDDTRSIRLRAAAAAAAAPLGMGLYLTFSRGALFAAAAGWIALVVLARSWPGLRGAAVALVAAAAGAALAAPFHAVTALTGSSGTRTAQGTAVLVGLVVVAAAAALVVVRVAGRERAGALTAGALPLPRAAPAIAVAVVLAGFGLFLAVGAKENSARPLATGATRLVTLQSNRYAYWRVAWRAFRAEPVRGVGGGGWAVYWLRYRTIDEGAQDAHSLYLQTLAELGVVGALALLGFLGGAAWAARRAHGLVGPAAAGPAAALVVWVAHVAVDWDWEMPAATLPVLLMVGALVAMSEMGAGGSRRAT